MKTPLARLLVICTLVVAVAMAWYYFGTPDTKPVASTPGTERESNSTQHGFAGNRLPEDDHAAAGHDGTFTTAPVRPADSLIDPQPADAPFAAGEKASAWVMLGTKVTPELQVNQFGEFPRAYIAPGQEVTVRVRFPDAEPGSRVAVQVEDGGKFADGRAVLALNLDEKSEASFRFHADKEPGLYRISVHHGPEWKIVQLWASTDPKLAINH